MGRFHSAKETELKQGIVVRAVRGEYVVDLDGEITFCALRGNLKKHLEYNTTQSASRRVTRAKVPHTADAIAVGDRVLVASLSGGRGVIEEILPRSSHFSRSGFRGREQTVVANVDTIIVVFAAVEPRLDPWKLDRFLVAAEQAEIPPLIVLNKCELVPPEEPSNLLREFADAGYPWLAVSAHTGEGMDALRTHLVGRVCGLTGPSGVGKSSILNALLPDAALKTSDIGYVTYKGRHTTVAAQLLRLPEGGWVADTPGLRNLEMTPMDREELAWCFPEIRRVENPCRFRDCRHASEPGCAVQAAVDAGLLSNRRRSSFLALAEEVEARAPAGR